MTGEQQTETRLVLLTASLDPELRLLAAFVGAVSSANARRLFCCRNRTKGLMELHSSAKRHTLGSFRLPFRRMDSRSLFMAIAGSYEKGSRGDTRLGLDGAVKYSGDTRTMRIVGFVESTRMGFLFTVEPLIRHTPRWTVDAMSYGRLCVMRGRFWCKT